MPGNSAIVTFLGMVYSDTLVKPLKVVGDLQLTGLLTTYEVNHLAGKLTQLSNDAPGYMYAVHPGATNPTQFYSGIILWLP